jgi:hypothetical protein
MPPARFSVRQTLIDRSADDAPRRVTGGFAIHAIKARMTGA